MPVKRLQCDRRISQPDVEAGRRAVLRLRASQDSAEVIQGRAPLLPKRPPRPHLEPGALIKYTKDQEESAHLLNPAYPSNPANPRLIETGLVGWTPSTIP